MKHILVDEKTHNEAKKRAKKLGMTLQGYIAKLVRNESKNDNSN